MRHRIADARLVGGKVEWTALGTQRIAGIGDISIVLEPVKGGLLVSAVLDDCRRNRQPIAIKPRIIPAQRIRILQLEPFSVEQIGPAIPYPARSIIGWFPFSTSQLPKWKEAADHPIGTDIRDLIGVGLFSGAV